MGLRAYRQETTPAEHEAAVALAEDRLGRKLSAGEKRIDIVAIDRDLKNAKRLLVEAIQKEQARAVRAFAEQRTPIRINVTDDMRSILADLYDAGVDHAKTELKAAGVDVG